MTNSEDIADLKSEIRELRNIIEGILDEPKQPPIPFTKLARREGDEVGGFQPIIFQTSSLDDRQSTPIYQAQAISDLLVIEHEGEWFYLDGAANKLAKCICEFIALLESKNHLSEITEQEWTDLKTTCVCDGLGFETTTCSNCQDNEAATEYRVAISGVVAWDGAFPAPPSAQQLTVDFLNQTHILPEVSPCTWQLTQQLMDGATPIDISITFTVNADTTTLRIDTDYNNQGTPDIGTYTLNHPGSDPDCLNPMVLPFSSQSQSVTFALVRFPEVDKTVEPNDLQKPEDKVTRFLGEHAHGVIPAGETAEVQYQKFDMVTDERWLAVANTPTVARAAPIPTGPIRNVIDEPGPFTFATQSLTEEALYVGQRYTWPNDGYITSVRLWVPSGVIGYFAEMLMVMDPDDSDGLRRISTLVPRFLVTGTTVDAWRTVAAQRELLSAGVEFDVFAIYRPSGAPNTFTGDWNYVRTNAAPTSGQLAVRNNDPSAWRLHFNDDSSTNRESDLDNLHAGARIVLNGLTYSILSITKGGSDYSITVSPDTSQSPGLYTLDFEWDGASLIDYVEVANHFTAFPGIKGFVSDSYTAAPTLNDNAYGVDIQIQDAFVSQDWDRISAP